MINKNNLFYLFILFQCINSFSQNNSNPAENSLGIVYQFSTIGDGYDYGIGINANSDFGSSQGFGLVSQVVYLQPNEALSSFIDYGVSLDFSLKYDFEIIDGLEIAPTTGFGYFAIQSEQNNDREYYFSVGSTMSYFISDSIILGVDFVKPFLDGADLTIGTSIKFQI